ncbi:hypothetical protein NAL32_02890 [Chryseobacterium sp. Ch-15]|uniref:Uncharacterized protein n=1 Tax=Chryseobacterium muglaense TaxID=2893752 RepID=A0A9Q3UVZ8_9FLAO|nr:hypothetical protein [Chryseobacterium muglaense]MBD3903263.1 hypothetical protein [Chryseobacterium muglaense]MCC9036094.1 hypothetical protein [Chryseobacterium muglaense]MCM2553330.1 hypothetical protein [Chryseobacterium muglaense]
MEVFAKQNRQNLNKDANATIIDAKKIEKKAFLESDHTAELIAISTQCVYYEKKNNFKELISIAKLLSIKAVSYDEPIYNAIAKDYLFRAYTFSALKEKGLQNIKEGLAITDKVSNKNDSLFVDTQSNLLTSFSNYYSLERQPRERLKYIRLAILERKKFKNLYYRKKLKFSGLF